MEGGRGGGQAVRPKGEEPEIDAREKTLMRIATRCGTPPVLLCLLAECAVTCTTPSAVISTCLHVRLGLCGHLLPATALPSSPYRALPEGRRTCHLYLAYVPARYKWQVQMRGTDGRYR